MHNDLTATVSVNYSTLETSNDTLECFVSVFTGQRAVTLCSWEGNRRSGVALTMRHRLSGPSTYGLNGLDRQMSPAYAPEGHGPLYLFTFTQ